MEHSASSPPPTDLHRKTVRKISLSEEGVDRENSSMTAEERILMVWPLTLAAWQFANPEGFESRVQRHIIRIERNDF